MLLLGIVLFAIYLVFFKKIRLFKKKDETKYDEITDTMIECPTCKTYFSKDDGVLSNGKYYCSEKCLKH
ncbi:MAG: PP0621 family protein [Campylobacterota bacterium]|nr:PP0621 family protein [Campylobacterota bacterium]